MKGITTRIYHNDRLIYEETAHELFVSANVSDKVDAGRAVVRALGELTGWGLGGSKPPAPKEIPEKKRFALLKGGKEDD